MPIETTTIEPTGGNPSYVKTMVSVHMARLQGYARYLSMQYDCRKTGGH